MHKFFNNHRLLLFLLMVALVLYGWFGERIPSNNQTGWDGYHYAQYASRLPQMLENREIDSYHFFRLMPSLIIYLLFKLFHLEPNTSNIVNAFLACNTFLILLSAWYYFSLCKHFKINKYPEIIGFAGLFLNFSVLKEPYYYPVLTDTFAFAFGFIFVGEAMQKRWITATLIFILGAFTFPLFFITAFVLFIPFKSNLISSLAMKIFSVAKWVIPLSVFFLFVFYLLYGKQIIVAQYLMQIDSIWLYVSLPLLLFYLYKIFDVQTIAIPSSAGKWNEIKIAMSLFFFVTFYFILNRYVRTITIPEDEFTPATFLWNIFQQSIAKPLSFIVFHVTYFGPVVLLFIFYYKKCITEISKFGWPILFYIMTYLLLGIGSESRQFINAWPAFVVVLVLTINEINFNKKIVIAFLIICLLQSHFWLTINRPHIYESYQYGKFPEQFYFMHQGPFSSDTGYLINAVSCLFIAVMLWFVIKKQRLIPVP